MGSSRASVLVTIALAVITAGLLILFVRHVRHFEARAATLDKLKKVALALHSCNDAHRRLPPACDVFGEFKHAASLHVHLLPFIDQERVYASFLRKDDGRENGMVPAYKSTEDYTLTGEGGIQNFAANLRVFSTKGFNTLWDRDMPPLGDIEPGSAAIPRTFLDGTSNTVVFATKLAVCGDGGSRFAADPASNFAAFFGEHVGRKPAQPSDPEAIFQLAPREPNCVFRHHMAQSFAPDGILVVFADSTARLISPGVDVTAWNKALQPNDIVPTSPEWQ